MHIRKAKPEDLPAVIALLKQSLGENLLPKSEELWLWKHVANPFGKSPLLICEDQGVLCGVRVFLKWEYRKGKEIIKACRAVDTAIHPSFQRKGIFKKLTLSLLEEMKEENINLIYNTPNSQSMPGYLNMGWEKWGKFPLKIQFHLGSAKNKHLLDDSDWPLIEPIVREIENSQADSQLIKTNLINGYIKWRYITCPLFPYHFISDGETYLLVYRVKDGKIGRELRIVDFFKLNSFGANEKKELNEKLTSIQNAIGARFTSLSGIDTGSAECFNLGFLPIMNVGPYITLKQLKNSPPLLQEPWGWSIGDLEVF